MSKPKQPSIFIRNNPAAPQLCPELAKEIGLNESILLLQWEFWLRSESQERDGHLWLRKTIREIREAFPFWGIATVQRTLGSLSSEKRPLFVLGSFDEGPGRGAGWFRLNLEELQKLKSIRVDCSKMEQRMFQNDQKTDQNGTSVLNNVLKNIDISAHAEKSVPAPGYKQPKQTKTLLPDEFPVTEGMRNWARGIGLSDDRIDNSHERYTRHVRKIKKRLYLDAWPLDWEEWMLNDLNFVRAGKGIQGDDQNWDYHRSLVAPEKPDGYFEKINAQYQKQ